MSYRNKANEDARETVQEYRDEILEQLNNTNEASNDLLNDYGSGDSYHHESHVDKRYNLTDAAELIDELSDYEETDSGLWEGQRPKEAIETCAAYTYGNVVYSFWTDLIEEINNAAETLIDEYNDLIDDAELAEEEEDKGYEGDTVAELAEKKTAALNTLLDQIISG